MISISERDRLERIRYGARMYYLFLLDTWSLLSSCTDHGIPESRNEVGYSITAILKLSASFCVSLEASSRSIECIILTFDYFTTDRTSISALIV